MRILILNRVEAPTPGATGRLLADLANDLRTRGHTVQAVTVGKIPPHILPYIFAWLAIGLRAMFAPRADRVVVMSDPPLLPLWIPVLKLRHKKIIYWCQDMYPDLLPVIGIRLPKLVQSLLKIIMRWSLLHADKTIVIGRCMGEKMIGYTSQFTLIPNWPERDHRPPVAPDPVFTLLYAGNLGRVHPVADILTAAQSCADLPVRIVFMISGHGRKILMDSLAHQSNVTFLPPQPWDSAKTIQENAHVHWVSLSSHATGLAVPVKYYAALRAGRPVIFMGEETCEIAQHMRENQCGDVVLPQNLRALLQSYLHSDQLEIRAESARRAYATLPDSLSMVAQTLLAA